MYLGRAEELVEYWAEETPDRTPPPSGPMTPAQIAATFGGSVGARRG